MSKKKSRRNRRIRSVLLAVSMMMVVAMASVGVTVAWLTDTTDAITNTFISSNIKIDLTESTGLNSKMVPGSDITKNPIVTVKGGSEACWLFVEVTESDNFDDFMTYAMDEGWTALADNDGVYYREVNAVAADAEESDLPSFPVFKGNKVTVRNTVTKEMMDALDAENAAQPTLTVKAYACQQAHVDTAADAWANISSATDEQPETNDAPAGDNA